MCCVLPIIVAGRDHSGTSWLASLLQAQGVDLGDVEDAPPPGRPEQYRTFEDRQWLAQFPSAAYDAWARQGSREGLAQLAAACTQYLAQRRQRATGRFGVKHNGLLPLYGRVPGLWLTTTRRSRSATRSRARRLCTRLQGAAWFAAQEQAQQAAHAQLVEALDPACLFDFDAARRVPDYVDHFVEHLRWRFSLH